MPPKVVYDIKLQGCTDEEIDRLKIDQAVEYIPQVYRELMRLMGHSGIGQFLDGKANYEYLPQMKEIFNFNVREKLDVPDDLFVFFSHQGYIWYFFRTNKREDDPAVYGCTDSLEGFYKLADSLSEFLQGHLDGSLKSVIDKKALRYSIELDDFVS